MMKIKFITLRDLFKTILDESLSNSNRCEYYYGCLKTHVYIMESYNYYGTGTVSEVLHTYNEFSKISQQSIVYKNTYLKHQRDLLKAIRLFNKYNTLNITIDKDGYVQGEEEALIYFKMKYL